MIQQNTPTKELIEVIQEISHKFTVGFPFNPNPTAFMHICLKELSQSEDAIVTQLTNQKLGTLPLSPGSTPTLFLITGIPAVP